MNNNPFFSLVIPCYEAHGQGVKYLEKQFSILVAQTYTDFEIVISDNSKNDEIESFINKYKNVFNIKYFKNSNIGNSQNANNGIKNSNGKFIKIIFQDDFLYNENSLKDIASVLNDDVQWLITACEHSNDGQTFYRSFFPRYNNEIYLGNNTISSPSVLTIKNTKDKLFFDENLKWLMDVDYYKRCFIKFGPPLILNNINVVNRTNEFQYQNHISEEDKNKEFYYVKNKFENIQETFFNRLVNLNFDHHTLYSRGIVDINEHLPTLRSYASRCDHVTEMGVRFATSTHALLIAKPKKVVSIDLNYHFFKSYEKSINDFAFVCETSFQFIESDVLKIDIEQTDLLFIDTLHTYHQLLSELNRHEKNVNKWIILHDTVTFGYTDEEFYQNGKISEIISSTKKEKVGLKPAVEDFLKNNTNWKIEKEYTNNNGLTILKRISQH